MKNILVAGGAGYIGSHTVLALKSAGLRPVVYDNLSNGHADAVSGALLIEGDIRDKDRLSSVLKQEEIDAVIHFAAFIEAGISVKDPYLFYDNNVSGSLSLLAAMKEADVSHIVFSSTAAVYGSLPHDNAISETDQTGPINPYGETKRTVEYMLRDAAEAYGLKAMALRYFNAAGAEPDAGLGERHSPETHLIPLVLMAAAGKRDAINIFGTDYNTPDGTCIRDYIHVMDLADAHIRALHYLSKQPAEKGHFDYCNLGNGAGYSVREVIETVKTVTGHDFTVKEEARRPGDPARLIAKSEKAADLLGWTPKRPSLKQIISEAWDFHVKDWML